MNRRTARVLLPVLLLLLVPLAGCSDRVAQAKSELDYPSTKRVDHVDVYHGVEIADPYRWLEDEESDETRAWVEAQDGLLTSYVSRVTSRDSIARRVAEVSDLTTYSIPTVKGGREFFTVREPDRNQSLLVVRDGGRSKDAEPRVLLDPETAIPREGLTFNGFSASNDGKHVTFASAAQSGWGRIEVIRVSDGKRLADRAEGTRGSSGTWTHDGKGFFYVTYGALDALIADSTEPRQRLLYHRLGTPASEDPVVFDTADHPQLLFSTKLSDDGRYMVLSLFKDGVASKNQVAYIDLEQRGYAVKMLIDEADAGYTFEGNVGRRFLFTTDLAASRSRVIAVDLRRPARKDWKELIPERAAAIGSVSHIGNRLVVRSVEDAVPVVDVFGNDGTFQRRLELPTLGLIGGFNDEPKGSKTLYTLNNLFDRGTIYEADLATGKSRVYLRPDLPYDPEDFELKQVFYDSADGTRVPMFVAYKKGLKLDGKAPLYMYGYGHGGWQAFPWFQPFLLVFMEQGGVYALPGIRGGGEYGVDWQMAGTRRNKRNTIADFVAAAEWLIDNDYTSADRLVANGGSASGILPAAAIVERPDLFGAAVIDFPFLDMLRYHEYTTFKGWTGGYGTSADAEDFAVLHSYSPIHNLSEDTCYPAVLTIVGGADQTTVPMHGYKFTAAMQSVQDCDKPILLKEVRDAGHYSYGLTREERHETATQILTFLMRALEWDANG